jgi:pimeloyl-ACP methyl ester carboxylesterase
MPRHVIHFQKHHEADGLWDTLTTAYGPEEYCLVSIDRTRTATVPQEDAETVVHILHELQWYGSILIAHGDDCRLACDLAALASARISALFLVDAPEELELPPFPPFPPSVLHVTTVEGVRRDPFVLEKKELLPEVFHAFCTLKLRAH